MGFEPIGPTEFIKWFRIDRLTRRVLWRMSSNDPRQSCVNIVIISSTDVPPVHWLWVVPGECIESVSIPLVKWNDCPLLRWYNGVIVVLWEEQLIIRIESD